jgi:hypothetical protein
MEAAVCIRPASLLRLASCCLGDRLHPAGRGEDDDGARTQRRARRALGTFYDAHTAPLTENATVFRNEAAVERETFALTAGQA